MILMLILVMAFSFGAAQGAQAARREVGEHYRQKKTQYADRNAVAAGEAGGVALGALASTTAHSLGLAARGFRQGWTRGWPKGREWVLDRTNRRRMRPYDDRAALAPRTAKPAETTTASAPDPLPERLTPRAKETIPGPRTDTDGPPESTTVPANQGVRTMPITTTTAEATSHTALLAALDAIVNEAVANHDDACADLARSNQEVTNVEALAAGLSSEEIALDPESVGQVQALVEPFKQRAMAAEQRLASCEALKAQAEQAKQVVVAKHQMMKEAHDSNPDAAQKAYYQGD
ncbi:hypothetical protein ADK76_28955 [Streptomyces griseoflavus]|uniref:hypothetical protein n=1 Tax=Streptomyces rimosus TaxID=1927 RepID=UPI0004C5AD81|nr:hypothetical protein [Streptomyces rimosus]KOG53145.1 hypothetical protein ADK76_28955 [Streptomyces griseoflavus]